jgi:hypothetical protein
MIGNAIAWQAYSLKSNATAIANIAGYVTHVMNDLAIPQPAGPLVGNRGYFVRDNMTETSLTINGTVYQVQSDAQNGSDNDMSQDQLIHMLFGYTTAVNELKEISSTKPQAAQLLALIQSHADQIGLYLKYYNYVITTPSGQPAKRGADARAFAWPIAQTLALITGNGLSRYLESVNIIDEKNAKASLNASELKDLFATALDGLTAGVCDIKVGKDKHPLCNRFTLRLINILADTSQIIVGKQAYILRMDDDGDYMGGFAARALIDKKIPKKYLQQLETANTSSFTSQSGPDLWCMSNRWIYMPTSCPDAGGGNYAYNSLDFLAFYFAMKGLATE